MHIKKRTSVCHITKSLISSLKSIKITIVLSFKKIKEKVLDYINLSKHFQNIGYQNKTKCYEFVKSYPLLYLQKINKNICVTAFCIVKKLTN